MPLVFFLVILSTTFISALIVTLALYLATIVIPDLPAFSPFMTLTVAFIAFHLLYIVETAIYKSSLSPKYNVDITPERAEVKKSRRMESYPFVLHYILLFISVISFLLTFFITHYFGLTYGKNEIISGLFVKTFGLFFSYGLILLIAHVVYLNKNVRKRLGREDADFSFLLGVMFFLLIAIGMMFIFLYDTAKTLLY